MGREITGWDSLVDTTIRTSKNLQQSVDQEVGTGKVPIIVSVMDDKGDKVVLMVENGKIILDVMD